MCLLWETCISYHLLLSHMLFSTVRDSYAQLYKSGSIWQDEFELMELDEIMRQRGDSAFAELLCRVRTASCTSDDIAVLESRVVSPDSPDYPSEALHVYKLNADVDEHNDHMLRRIPSTVKRYAVKASDATTGQTKHIDLASLVCYQRNRRQVVYMVY